MVVTGMRSVIKHSRVRPTLLRVELTPKPTDTDSHSRYPVTAITVAGPDVEDGTALPSCCDLGMLMANRW
jgi:hypothetical protein